MPIPKLHSKRADHIPAWKPYIDEDRKHRSGLTLPSKVILCFQSDVFYFLFQALIILPSFLQNIPSPYSIIFFPKPEWTRLSSDSLGCPHPNGADNTVRSQYQAVTLTCQHSTHFLNFPSFGRHTETLMHVVPRKFIQLRHVDVFTW